MDALEFFLLRHQSLHTIGPTTIYVDFERLPADHMRAIPAPGLNSIAWLVWHIARVEDIGVNRLVSDHPQVFDGAAWGSQLAVPRRDVGTSMTEGEVADLSRSVDLDALRAYWAAVGERTRAVVTELRPEALDEPIGDEHIWQVFVDEGTFSPAARWIPESGMYNGSTRGRLLAHWGLTHSYMHYGEMGVIQSLLGVRGR